MRNSINVPPPEDFTSFSPSELFKFYFQVGRWTEDSFSDALQSYTRGKLVSTVTISKWKNKNVIPTRYSGAFLKMIETLAEPALAKRWTTAFETVWALHSAGRTARKPQSNMSTFSDEICALHRKWIEKLYCEKRPGDPFSPSEIYVPLQISDSETNISTPQNVESVLDRLTDGKENPGMSDWVFISGRPGAGKSMTALHMAHSWCEGSLFPIYLRGSHLSDIDIDIIDPVQPLGDSFSAKSYLKHFRASSFDEACIIIDGLDEINRGSLGVTHALSQFIAELENEQKVCAAHSKSLRIIAFGREVHMQVCANHLSTAGSRRFALCALDGTHREPINALNSTHGEDLRALWWKRYLAANGHVSDPSLPDFLTTEYDDFAEFGADPLLAFLICHSALENHDNSLPATLPHERVNAMTYASNKNEIYRSIIERQAKSARHLLDAKRFTSVLQLIALTVWQNGDGRNVSLQTVYDRIDAPEIEAAFQTLGLLNTPMQSPPDMLVTAFCYRLSHDKQQSEAGVIEFTHKTFAEYLVSTLLFDRFTEVVSAFGEGARFESALKDWIRVSTQGVHSPSLAGFCQEEAAIRFESLSLVDWDRALKMIRDHFYTHDSKTAGIGLISELQHANNLLLFIWSCLNVERQKRTDNCFILLNEGPNFNVADLKNIQSRNGLNLKSGSPIEPTLRDLSFLTQTLSALHLKTADMSQLSFSLGHVQNLICEDSSFAMTHWSHVKLSSSSFARTIFQQAIFHHWRAVDTRFSNCLFQGSRFQGSRFSNCQIEETYFSQCHFADVEFIASQFKNVVFDRCIFSQCAFSSDKTTASPLTAQFRHCTFMDMETSLRNIAPKNMINSISEGETEMMRSPTDSHNIKTALDELL